MLKYFRSNQPVVIILLLVYLAILKAHLFIMPAELELSSTAPLSEAVYFMLEWLNLNGYYITTLLACASLFIQALMINGIMDKHRLASEFNYLPAVAYLLLTSFFVQFSALTPPLMAAFFIIPALDKLLGMYKLESADLPLFDVGLYVGVASLFYFPSILLVVWIFIAVAYFKPFKLREWFIVITGLLAPYFLVAVYYFWNDQLTEWYDLHIASVTNTRFLTIGFDTVFFLKTGLLLITSLIYILHTLNEVSHGVIQLRKSMYMILLLFIVLLASILLEPEGSINQLVLVMIPLSIIYGFSFQTYKTDEWSEIPHFILILTVLITQYLNFVKLPEIF